MSESPCAGLAVGGVKPASRLPGLTAFLLSDLLAKLGLVLPGLLALLLKDLLGKSMLGSLLPGLLGLRELPTTG